MRTANIGIVVAILPSETLHTGNGRTTLWSQSDGYASSAERFHGIQGGRILTDPGVEYVIP